jgi:hypothetical protein
VLLATRSHAATKNHRELLLPRVCHQCIQTGTASFSARDSAIFVLMHDFQSELLVLSLRAPTTVQEESGSVSNSPMTGIPTRTKDMTQVRNESRSALLLGAIGASVLATGVIWSALILHSWRDYPDAVKYELRLPWTPRVLVFVGFALLVIVCGRSMATYLKELRRK